MAAAHSLSSHRGGSRNCKARDASRDRKECIAQFRVSLLTPLHFDPAGCKPRGAQVSARRGPRTGGGRLTSRFSYFAPRRAPCSRLLNRLPFLAGFLEVFCSTLRGQASGIGPFGGEDRKSGSGPPLQCGGFCARWCALFSPSGRNRNVAAALSPAERRLVSMAHTTETKSDEGQT